MLGEESEQALRGTVVETAARLDVAWGVGEVG